MDGIERLVQTSELKSNLLREQSGKAASFEVDYDPNFDALIVKLPTTPDDEVVAHYVDGQVALLYLSDSFEVIGIQVEDFELSFLPRHGEVARVWKLSDAETTIDHATFGELALMVKTRTPKVVREVVKAAVEQESLGEPGNELLAAVA